jgi:hypothetical protein
VSEVLVRGQAVGKGHRARSDAAGRLSSMLWLIRIGALPARPQVGTRGSWHGWRKRAAECEWQTGMGS